MCAGGVFYTVTGRKRKRSATWGHNGLLLETDFSLVILLFLRGGQKRYLSELDGGAGDVRRKWVPCTVRSLVFDWGAARMRRGVTRDVGSADQKRSVWPKYKTFVGKECKGDGAGAVVLYRQKGEPEKCIY